MPLGHYRSFKAAVSSLVWAPLRLRARHSPTLAAIKQDDPHISPMTSARPPVWKCVTAQFSPVPSQDEFSNIGSF